MPVAKTATMKTFRTMDTLSGDVRVISGSRRRMGVRPPNRRAIDRSPESQAASDDERGKTRELAAVSAASSTGRKKPSAEVAKGKAKEAERAPDKGTTGEPPSLWDQRAELGKGPLLPQDGWAFLKALNERIDVVALYELMLRSTDEKLAGRLVEQALKLGYEQNPNAEEEWGAPMTAHLP
jgi:hypothetical protein